MKKSTTLKRILMTTFVVLCAVFTTFGFTGARAEENAADEIVARGPLARMRYEFSETEISKDGFIAITMNVKDIKNTSDAFAYIRISLYHGETEYSLALPKNYNGIKTMPEGFTEADYAATGGSGRVTADRIKCYTTDGKAYSVANKKTSGTADNPQSYYVIKKGFNGTFYIYLGDFLTENVTIDGISFLSDMTHYVTYTVGEVFTCSGKENENKTSFTPVATEIVNNSLTRNGKKITSENVGTSVRYTEKGSETEIEVKAESGWYFYSVKLNGENVKNQLVNGVLKTDTENLAEFSATCLEYMVSVAADIKNGTVTYYKNGDKTIAVVTAKPDNGYKLVKITANGEEIVGTEIPINGNIVINAEFIKAEVKYGVSQSSEGKGKVDKTENSDGSVTFKFTPTDRKYTLKEVTVNGEDVTDSVVDGKYTITEYHEDINLIATFDARTVQIETTGNGTATYRIEGDNVIITATPNDGSYLYSVTVNGNPVNTDENGEYAALFDKNYKVTATFKDYKSEFTSTDGGSVTVKTTEDRKITEYTVKPDFGYIVKEAYLNGKRATINGETITAANDKDNFMSVIFESLVTVSASGNGYADYTTNETDGSVEFTVVADNGYETESVTVNGIDVTLTDGKYKCELKGGVYFKVTFTESKPAPVTEKGGCNSGITVTAPIIFVITALAALALIGGRKNEE